MRTEGSGKVKEGEKREKKPRKIAQNLSTQAELPAGGPSPPHRAAAGQRRHDVIRVCGAASSLPGSRRTQGRGRASLRSLAPGRTRLRKAVGAQAQAPLRSIASRGMPRAGAEGTQDCLVSYESLFIS